MSLTFQARVRRARMMKVTVRVGGPLLALISCLLIWHLTAPTPEDAPLEPAGSSSPSGPTRVPSAVPGVLVQDLPSPPVANSPLAALETETDPEHKTEALERIFPSLADPDRLKILESLLNRADPPAAELRQLLVRRWAEGNPQAAAAWAALLPDGPAQTEAVSQVAIAWANIDLTAAVAWASSLPESAAKQVALADLAYEGSRIAPETALTLADKLPPNSERDTLVVHAASQWAAADSSAATAWAEKVADPNLRQRLVAAVAVALAKQDGAAAARLAASGLAPGEEQDRAVVAIVQRWAQTSPLEALAWIRQFPNMSLRQAALQSVAALGFPVASVGP